MVYMGTVIARRNAPWQSHNESVQRLLRSFHSLAMTIRETLSM